MDLEFLKRLKGQLVSLEYAPPNRQNYAQFPNVFVFDVLANFSPALLVLLARSETAAPPEAPEGVAPTQSNVQSPTEMLAQFKIVCIKAEHVVGLDFLGAIGYRYDRVNPQKVYAEGAALSKQQAPTLYPFHHANWEKFQDVLETELQKQLDVFKPTREPIRSGDLTAGVPSGYSSPQGPKLAPEAAAAPITTPPVTSGFAPDTVKTPPTAADFKPDVTVDSPEKV